MGVAVEVGVAVAVAVAVGTAVGLIAGGKPIVPHEPQGGGGGGGVCPLTEPASRAKVMATPHRTEMAIFFNGFSLRSSDDMDGCSDLWTLGNRFEPARDGAPAHRSAGDGTGRKGDTADLGSHRPGAENARGQVYRGQEAERM